MSKKKQNETNLNPDVFKIARDFDNLIEENLLLKSVILRLIDNPFLTKVIAPVTILAEESVKLQDKEYYQQIGDHINSEFDRVFF